MYLDLYLLIVSIGMGSVYVIHYFATYLGTYTGGTCVHVHTVPLYIPILPTSASAA